MSSAFLFSTAKNNAKRPIVKINHGENSIPEAITPEIPLKRKPDAIQIMSSNGSFFSFTQYKICITLYKIIIIKNLAEIKEPINNPKIEKNIELNFAILIERSPFAIGLLRLLG